MTDHGRLLIAEAGDGSAGSGRISMLDRDGNRRTLIDGLPSGPADVGTPSGVSGLFMQGRSLFIAMGTGDTGIMGPRPGTTLENLKGPSSPIFASVLAMHFSASAEHRTTGFTLTPANQQALAKGRTVWLHDSRWNFAILRMVTKFPNFVPTPVPGVPDNISLSNPFGIVGLGRSFYVTDGGRNLTWKVDRLRGTSAPFVAFPDIPNPLFPHVGGPFMQAVPTGIIAVHDKLLVTLLRGAPFATGTATVEQLDVRQATSTPLISNLTTAIGSISLKQGRKAGLLVLEYASAGPFFSGPGTVLRFDDPAGPPTKVADCLTAATSMTLDRRDGILYVTEEGGSLIGIGMP
ncbi:ScyD/ScyE family protein [Rhodanobacter lindaniclasticus]